MCISINIQCAQIYSYETHLLLYVKKFVNRKIRLINYRCITKHSIIKHSKYVFSRCKVTKKSNKKTSINMFRNIIYNEIYTYV